MFKVYFIACDKEIRKNKKYKKYIKNKKGNTLRETEEFLRLLHEDLAESIEISISIENRSDNKCYEFDLFIDKTEISISILDILESDLNLTEGLETSIINEMMKDFLNAYENETENQEIEKDKKLTKTFIYNKNEINNEEKKVDEVFDMPIDDFE